MGEMIAARKKMAAAARRPPCLRALCSQWLTANAFGAAGAENIPLLGGDNGHEQRRGCNDGIWIGPDVED